jgi:GNAT superfamily N-acetyltransferase
VTIRIDTATAGDLADIVASAAALVATDAARFDPSATNVDWAALDGSAYAAALLAGEDNLVLLARDGDGVVGHLVGRLHRGNSLHPVRVAELESIHVYPAHRGRGVGSGLVAAFREWATGRGAVRALVTAYAANEGALRFYVRHGFAPKSVVLDREL